ncbi:MAG TPA: hypothetical protein VH877_30865 [Polyangia bacterium]|jgi:hypothetical protein|nr:hypothetical protein [Polyangia bacterium]
MTSRDKLVPQSELAWEAPTYVIEMEGVQIWVRRHRREQGQMLFYVAELAVAGQEEERAIVEARSPEELSALLSAAIPAFAGCVRLRRQYSA